jgi:hypothetical protein
MELWNCALQNKTLDLCTLGIKFRIFWDVALCSHVEVYRRFRGAYCLHHQVIETRLHGAIAQKTLIFKF